MEHKEEDWTNDEWARFGAGCILMLIPVVAAIGGFAWAFGWRAVLEVGGFVIACLAGMGMIYLGFHIMPGDDGSPDTEE